MGIFGDLARTRRRRPFLNPQDAGDAPSSASRDLTPDSSSAHWTELGFRNFPLRDSVRPDKRTYIFPSAIGRAYADIQLLNGVSQLSAAMNIPPVGEHGLFTLARPIQNPTLAQRYGGRAQQAPGALTSQDWHDNAYAGIPTTGSGPGTITMTSRVRRRLGWAL